MAPAYLFALIVCGVLGLTLFTFAVNYTSKPLTSLSVVLSAFLFSLCSIFLSTDTIETETSKNHMEYGWPIQFVEANFSGMDPPIGYKMRLSGEPYLSWRPARMIANITIYLLVLVLILIPIKRTGFDRSKSKSKDRKITKTALVILFLVCFVPGFLFGITHLVHESDKYYCKSASISYERYHYPNSTIPDKNKCKSSLLAYQTWVAFFQLLFMFPLILGFAILEMFGLRELLFT